MKQTINNFPKFQAGQILTSEFLNNAFGYTEEQSRLTRSLMLGGGIVEGLHYSWSTIKKNEIKLTIRTGSAVTAEGYFLQLGKDTTFTRAVKINKIEPNPLSRGSNANTPDEMYLLFEKENAEAKSYGSVEKIPDISKFVLAIFAEFKPTDEEIKCSEVTCDIGKINFKITPRPVLIDAKFFPKPLRAKFSPIEGHVQMERFVGLSNAINVNTLMKKTRALFETNKAKVLELANRIGQLRNDKAWHKILDNDKRGTQRFYNTYKSLLYLCNEHQEIPDYYLWYLRDMGEAMNEFVDYYNDFREKYPIITVNRHHYGQIVLLGNGEACKDNAFRQTYQALTDDQDFITSSKALRRLFYRIIVMSGCFIGGDMGKSKLLPFKVTMQNPDIPLSERPIPYYYRITETLQKVWSAPMLAKKNCPNNYDKLPVTITHPANGADWALLLQGYYGKNVDGIKKLLEAFIEDNDLNIQVQSFEMNKTAIKKQHIETLKSKIFDANGISQIEKFKKEIMSMSNGLAQVHIRVPVYTGKKQDKTKLVFEEHTLSEFKETDLMMMHVAAKSKKGYRVLTKTVINGKEEFAPRTFLKKTILGNVKLKKLREEQFALITRKPILKDDPYLKIANTLLNFSKTDILKSIYNNEILSANDIEKGNNLLAGLNSNTQLLNFIQMVFYSNAANYTKAPYSQKHVAALFALKSFLEKQKDSNLRFAEFIEGSRNGSTLVLFHFRNRLIKIASIPAKKE